MTVELKKANIKWVEKFKFAGTGHSGHSILVDAPKTVGGDGSAITPGELVLVGLGGCTGIDVASLMVKMRASFRDFRIEIEAEPVDTHPKIYKWIKVIYKFYGCTDQAKARKAVGLSKDKYCSVSAILSKSADVSHEIIFED